MDDQYERETEEAFLACQNNFSAYIIFYYVHTLPLVPPCTFFSTE